MYRTVGIHTGRAPASTSTDASLPAAHPCRRQQTPGRGRKKGACAKEGMRGEAQTCVRARRGVHDPLAMQRQLPLPGVCRHIQLSACGRWRGYELETAKLWELTCAARRNASSGGVSRCQQLCA